MKRHVAEDSKTAMNVRNQGEGDDQDNITNIGFKFSFNTKEIQNDLKLPLEYETNIASFMETIECAPVINFDDLETFEEIEPLDFEIE